AGLACLREAPPSAATQLAIGRSLIGRPGDTEQRGETLLLQLALRHPATPEAREAVELLSESSTASSLAALSRLPPALHQSAPVAARRALRSVGSSATLAVLRRWPDDPASWELQWQRARLALLQGRWQEAISLLSEPRSAAEQPPLLASRRLFWLGFSHWQQGQRQRATALWRDLLQRHPGGYYGWRAAVRLGRAAMDPGRPAEPDRGSGSRWPAVMPNWIGCGGWISRSRPGSTGDTIAAASHPAPPRACWWRAGCVVPWVTTGWGWPSWSRRACVCLQRPAAKRPCWRRPCTRKPSSRPWSGPPGRQACRRTCWRQWPNRNRASRRVCGRRPEPSGCCS
ncbi:tol-pal system YbgF family protein, partial [Synechococcus sp. GFB01]|uniref:tetratricopeptide repeat protein n=1 Tax=Synechococcus sp. GFB01 TaxID=1662190 RepID=UPI00350F4CED